MVLLNAPTVSVHKSEIMLRRGKAFVRGKAVPFQSLCIIPGDTAAVSVHKSEIKLGTWVTSLGKLTKKLNCSCVIAPAKCGNSIFQRPCGDGHNAIQRENTCKEDTLQAGHVSGLFCLNHPRALNLDGDKNGAVGKADMTKSSGETTSSW